MTFCGKQQKPSMQYCFVEWSRVRLLVGLKQKKIDEILRSNAQRYVSGSLTNNGGQNFKKQGQNQQKSTKSMLCVYFNDNSCSFNKHHETSGVFYRHICSSCFAQEGKVSTQKKICENEEPWAWLRRLMYNLIMSRKIEEFQKMMLHLEIVMVVNL